MHQPDYVKRKSLEISIVAVQVILILAISTTMRTTHLRPRICSSSSSRRWFSASHRGQEVLSIHDLPDRIHPTYASMHPTPLLG